MTAPFRPTLVTAPAEMPVTVTDCRKHAVVENSESDDEITALIAAAMAHFDGFSGVLGRAIISQTWQLHLDRWRGDLILPAPDVSAAEIRYLDPNGAERPGPSVTRHAIATGTLLRLPRDWSNPPLDESSPAPIIVEFTCGFGSAAQVPFPIKVAILQMVAHMFAEREGISIAEPVYDRLIAPYRWSVI
ncbi:hypothetical protein K7H20_22035 [Salipiger manganoxidans]|uniref:head-tail connector protein n=1 Tax=Salipiger marinus TaxID=555512 RepID=UPI001E40FF3B|nr:hypothetical protein [Salipiger manganoxidans]MCD1620745.1 hypothetical protein [Salipiger manganoxidans]